MNLILIALAVLIVVIIALGFLIGVYPEVTEGQSVCFDDVNDFFKFKMQHINDTDYTVVYPCPQFNKSKIPEDESGQ